MLWFSLVLVPNSHLWASSKLISGVLFGFSFAVVSLQLHAFWQVGLMKSKAFPGACMFLFFFALFFCCEGDAVMFGVHCGRCLLLDSGANLCRCVIF
jgi:hypothetical protein